MEFCNKEKSIAESQRGLHFDLFYCLLLKKGVQCFPQVAVPERIGISDPYQRYPGERRFDPVW